MNPAILHRRQNAGYQEPNRPSYRDQLSKQSRRTSCHDQARTEAGARKDFVKVKSFQEPHKRPNVRLMSSRSRTRGIWGDRAAEEAKIDDRGVAGGPVEALKDRRSGREHAKPLGKNTRQRKHYRRPRRDSDDSSEEGWSKESDDGNNHNSSDNDYDSDRPVPRSRPHSRTTVNPRPLGVIINMDDRG
ncbi:hypothetical protein EC957_007681 [Mortierella hygrophila]|uniref:Uncharacterized protein n=1 Tax=Mortierella hygrophila TaxID=979708 RepID=A0A9P6EYC2_9FUNG|nr:hypothetical protein EC957_007681 [Mortierella hygrophila]